jgi:hypothetical protein
MNRPTGQDWRNWKKAETRKGHHPKDWAAHWDAQNKPKTEPGADQIRLLTMEIQRLKREAVNHAVVRHEILKLAQAVPPVPDWLTIHDSGTAKSPGVPTLFASDWHWGEVVDAAQIGGVNAYDLATARARAERLIGSATDLLKNHMVNPNYPGIVFALGGDMFSGDIHEELSRTNEMPVMPLVLDIWGVLTWCIQRLADEFGRVFVPCVTGNHSRNTLKMTSKERNHLSFDWLLYSLLEKHFEKDSRVCFLIPDGPDALYRVYGHRYLLTHGDQFRGGDGMIGALGPIIRGDHKKRSRNAQIGMEYDTLLLGHWHQLIQMQRLIVNGSLKGYDEYAHGGNFGFERPKQALWITHPEHGITFQMPVLVDGEAIESIDSWVSVFERGA